MRLSDLFPRPVPLTLAGGAYLARELRLADYATLEAMAPRTGAVAVPEPPEDGADRRAYRDALRSAYDAAERAEKATADDALRTLEGAAAFLLCVLRDSRLTADAAKGLALALTADEWDTVRAAARGRGRSTLESIALAIDVECGAAPLAGEPTPDSVTIEQAAAEAVTRWRMSVADAGELTLTQLNYLRSGGRSDGHWFDQCPSGKTMAWFEKEVLSRRSAFWEEAEDSAPAPAPDAT